MQVISNIKARFQPQDIDLNKLKTPEKTQKEVSRIATLFKDDIEKIVPVIEQAFKRLSEASSQDKHQMLRKGYASWIASSLFSLKNQDPIEKVWMATFTQTDAPLFQVSEILVNDFLTTNDLKLGAMQSEQWELLCTVFIQKFGDEYAASPFIEYLLTVSDQIPPEAWKNILPSLLNGLKYKACHERLLRRLLDNQGISLLIHILRAEIQNQRFDTVLRETRMWNVLFQLHLKYNKNASRWLHSILSPLFLKIPEKIAPSDPKNGEYVEFHVKEILQRLWESLEKNPFLHVVQLCPAELLLLLKVIQEEAQKRIEKDTDTLKEEIDVKKMGYNFLHVSFLFLTCLNPALIDPEKYALRIPDAVRWLENTQGIRIKIAKSLQTLVFKIESEGSPPETSLMSSIQGLDSSSLNLFRSVSLEPKTGEEGKRDASALKEEETSSENRTFQTMSNPNEEKVQPPPVVVEARTYSFPTFRASQGRGSFPVTSPPLVKGEMEKKERRHPSSMQKQKEPEKTSDQLYTRFRQRLDESLTKAT